MHVGAPVAARLDLVPLGHDVAEADLLRAVQAEVGLLVPHRGPVGVRRDGAVLEGQALGCGFGEALGGGREGAEEGEGRRGGEPGRHGGGVSGMCCCALLVRALALERELN